jgi:RNA polymerase sigma-70 factor (ECF subfamily)
MSPETRPSLLEQMRQQPNGGPPWQRFTDLYRPLLQSWVRRLARFDANDPDSEDLVSSVLLVVCRRFGEFRHNGRAGAFRAWLKTILIHCVRDFHRARRPIAPGGDEWLGRLEELEDARSPLGELWDQEHDAHVFRRLREEAQAEFPPERWRIFERVALGEEKSTAVADELGVPVNVVYRTRHEVLSWLRQRGQGLID